VARRLEKPAVGGCGRRRGKARERLVTGNRPTVQIDDRLQVDSRLLRAGQQGLYRALPDRSARLGARAKFGNGVG